MLKKLFCFFILVLVAATLYAQPTTKLKRKDYTKDVKLVTDKGTIILRLSDSTPLHRANFLKLVKSKYYNGIAFHRVIKGFMAQAGNAATKTGKDTSDRLLGNYTIDAEILPMLYHKKGALAAARMGDDVNPGRRSSGVQFYIVQGKTFTDAQLDSVQIRRLQGKTISEERREHYKTIGGTPQLDGAYTVFGEVVKGLDVVDAIANTPTSKQPPDKPTTDIRIKKAKLVKRR